MRWLSPLHVTREAVCATASFLYYRPLEVLYLCLLFTAHQHSFANHLISKVAHQHTAADESTRAPYLNDFNHRLCFQKNVMAREHSIDTQYGIDSDHSCSEIGEESVGSGFLEDLRMNTSTGSTLMTVGF